jgi:iron-sulfur cluster insertion protein
MSEVAEAPGITISENAAKRIAGLAQQEGNANLMLRVSVSGGGCSGFQYGFDFADSVNADDRTFHRDGVTVVVDEISLELLQGSEIDFVEDLIGSYFEIKNPNASSSCGCGSSFSI